ncbi:beta-lactamase family protein [Streptomyces sp. AV19]|uniref:serine hydrolase domain-containing protein n=1 Tax=Streptomyces sp. AV19 TaxID=2793068 RepID=UPI0018FED927|nr:serine hydrolase domain-containing protein [Streptomyces sp. AV19]MBH1937760.1 beta-lactamase family protein [Streptomyces sp. AV19]MDG4536429.1 beta-lactamase family protein [Streptomyces sp. AV19]
MTSTFPSRRALVGATLTAALLAGVGAPAAFAAAPPPRTAVATPAVPPLDRAALRAAISDLDHPQATAAQLRVGGKAGSWYGTAGVADRRTGAPVRPDDTFRAGSVTKAFVATAVLQLSAEGRVDLDRPVQDYLPGLLPRSYAPVKVSQLLDHTSGLPNEVGGPEIKTPEQILEHRYDRWTPKKIVATLPDGPMKFTPGTKQEYRGMNYVLAALLVEKVTGRPYGKVIGQRILRPLGLRHTSFPGDDPKIHGPHVHGYLAMSDGTLRDATEYDQSEAWGEGELISTTGDLERFITALFAPGKLLPKATLDKMFTLPGSEVRMVDGSPARFGMGLQTVTVNGVTLWGKTGERYGYNSGVFATRDLRRTVAYSWTPTHRDMSQQEMVLRIANAVTKPVPPAVPAGR